MKDKKKKQLICNLALLGGIAIVIISFMLGEIGFFTIIIGVAFIIASFVERKRINRIFCRNCCKKYDYEADVEWEEVEETVTEKSRKSTVEITCHCRQCGQAFTFSEKFTTGSVDKNGNVKETPLSVSVKKYFK